MRTSTAAVIGAIVLTATCGYLSVRLRAEQQRADAESDARARQAERIVALERERDALAHRVQRLRRTAAASSSEAHAPAYAAPASPGAPSSAPPSPVTPAAAQPATAAIPEGLRRMGQLRTHGELVRALGLSATEAEELLELLLRLEQDALAVELAAPPDPAALRHELHALQQRKDAAIVELLGSERAHQYRAFQDSRRERAELRMIGEHLDLLGTPLDPEQRKTLLGILTEEADRAAPAEATPMGDELEQLRRAQAETQRRIHERATRLLDPEQAAHLAQYYALHTLTGGGGPARATAAK